MIHIALCADNNYAMPAGVMIYSVCKHTVNVAFHMITSKDFTRTNRKKIEKITNSFGVDIEFITVPDNITEGWPTGMLNQAKHITIATYYRLLLTTLMPRGLDKILYLDCDLICLQSLEELWETNIENIPLACVKDVPYDGICESIRLGYAESMGYFNAGVLLINLDYWRENDVLGQFMTVLSSSPEILKSHDQDVLNIVFSGKVLFLPPKFNAVDLLFYDDERDLPYLKRDAYEAIHSPVIVHFTYIKKPWIKGYGHTYEKVFLEYKKATPWRYSMLKMAKPDSLKGFISGLFVFMGLHTYSNNYVKLERD